MKKHYVINYSNFRLDGGAMYGIIPKPLWNKVSPADQDNRIDLALRMQLIQTDTRNILIDTGIGEHNGDKFDQRFDVRYQKHGLEKALESLNLKTDDITDIVLSHLHFDHVGGLGDIENGQMTPVFKNATLHLHQLHFEYGIHPSERDAGSFHSHNFIPLIEFYKSKNQIHWVTDLEGDLIPNILKYKCSFGHTPYLLHPYDEKFIYLADLIPTSNHIHIPWVMGYDIEPVVTTQYKREFLGFIKQNDLTIIYEHDPIYWGSKVSLDDRGNFIASPKFDYNGEIVLKLS